MKVEVRTNLPSLSSVYRSGERPRLLRQPGRRLAVESSDRGRSPITNFSRKIFGCKAEWKSDI